jgi:hypothetical protein
VRCNWPVTRQSPCTATSPLRGLPGERRPASTSKRTGKPVPTPCGGKEPRCKLPWRSSCVGSSARRRTSS